MRILLQRVRHASVTVDRSITGAIAQGLLLLVGFGSGDTADEFPTAISKILGLRVFGNDDGKFDKTVEEVSGGLLLVPQFTLYADTKKGRRPDFTRALAPDFARPLFGQLVSGFEKATSCKVAQGIFGAHMEVELLNDGPVTLMLEF